MAEKFTRFTAVAAPYDPVNVDTDQIIPARFLKAPREQGYGAFLFHDARERADFFLNHPVFGKAKILVANTNFGCGSSREGAPYAFHDAGFRSIIAPSFGDIFFNNCMKNGIVPVRLGETVCASLRKFLRENPGAEVTVDLASDKATTPLEGEQVAHEGECERNDAAGTEPRQEPPGDELRGRLRGGGATGSPGRGLGDRGRHDHPGQEDPHEEGRSDDVRHHR